MIVPNTVLESTTSIPAGPWVLAADVLVETVVAALLIALIGSAVYTAVTRLAERRRQLFSRPTEAAVAEALDTVREDDQPTPFQVDVRIALMELDEVARRRNAKAGAQ
jgi:hypothetical protein